MKNTNKNLLGLGYSNADGNCQCVKAPCNCGQTAELSNAIENVKMAAKNTYTKAVAESKKDNVKKGIMLVAAVGLLYVILK